MDSSTFLVFEAARVMAYFAMVPGSFFIWLGWRRRFRSLLRMSLIAVAILVVTCAIALFSSQGSHADAWDSLGAIYWSSIAAIQLALCGAIGLVAGKLRALPDATVSSD